MEVRTDYLLMCVCKQLESGYLHNKVLHGSECFDRNFKLYSWSRKSSNFPVHYRVHKSPHALELVAVLSFVFVLKYSMPKLYKCAVTARVISDHLIMDERPVSLLRMLSNFCFASTAIKQAFLATSEAQRREKLPVLSCEHCPMVWYHKLCAEVEGEDIIIAYP